jgi:hypothetical protein
LLDLPGPPPNEGRRHFLIEDIGQYSRRVSNLKRQQNQTAGDEYPVELVELLSQMNVGYVDDRIPRTDPADAVVRDAEIRQRSIVNCRAGLSRCASLIMLGDKSIPTTAILLLVNMAVVTPVPQPTSMTRLSSRFKIKQRNALTIARSTGLSSRWWWKR